MNMVEKVARALCELDGHNPDGPLADIYVQGDPDAGMPWASYRRQASAAIKAMREPTSEMIADDEVHWDYSCHVCGGLRDGYEKMIDAASVDISDIA